MLAGLFEALPSIWDINLDNHSFNLKFFEKK